MADTHPGPASAKRRNRIFAVVAVSIAAVALGVITVGGIGENLVYYWGPTEVRAAGEKAIGATIRLGGQVAPQSVKRAASGSLLQFEVMDRDARIPVRSAGVPPQMFREGIGVVVEGTMTSAGYFESNRLMVSHGNEYKSPEAGEKIDAARLIRSVSDEPAPANSPQ